MDIEKIRPLEDMRKVATHFFSREESEDLLAASGQREPGVLPLDTRGAYVKAVGEVVYPAGQFSGDAPAGRAGTLPPFEPRCFPGAGLDAPQPGGGKRLRGGSRLSRCPSPSASSAADRDGRAAEPGWLSLSGGTGRVCPGSGLLAAEHCVDARDVLLRTLGFGHVGVQADRLIEMLAGRQKRFHPARNLRLAGIAQREREMGVRIGRVVGQRFLAVSNCVVKVPREPLAVAETKIGQAAQVLPDIPLQPRVSSCPSRAYNPG